MVGPMFASSGQARGGPVPDRMPSCRRRGSVDRHRRHLPAGLEEDRDFRWIVARNLAAPCPAAQAAPAVPAAPAKPSELEGPVVDGTRTDVVTDQNEVDDLLARMGF